MAPNIEGNRTFRDAELLLILGTTYMGLSYQHPVIVQGLGFGDQSFRKAPQNPVVLSPDVERFRAQNFGVGD